MFRTKQFGKINGTAIPVHMGKSRYSSIHS